MHYIRNDNLPLFALHSQNEHMFPLKIAEEFAHRSRACGNSVQQNPYPRTEHGFFIRWSALSNVQRSKMFGNSGWRLADKLCESIVTGFNCNFLRASRTSDRPMTGTCAAAQLPQIRVFTWGNSNQYSYKS